MKRLLPPQMMDYFKFPPRLGKSPYLVALAALLIVVFTVSFLYPNSYLDFLIKKSPESAVAKVGKELIYQTDLDYYLSVYFPKEKEGFLKRQEATDKSLSNLIDNSIILQEGEKEGFIELSSDVFNSQDKKVASRNAMIEVAKKKIENKYVDKVSGEIISIWFHNASYPPPKMGLEAAKEATNEKMKGIYSDLKSGKIDFQAAAKKIINDASLNDIDPSYQENAYFFFKDRIKSEKIANDPKVDQVVWSLKPRELSEVLMVNDFDSESQKPFEAYFSVVKLTKRTAGDFVDFQSWLSAVRGRYEVKEF